MKIRNPFKTLTKWEWILYAVSVIVVSLSFFVSKQTDYLTLTASLIGVTALIFVSKGDAVGQILTVVFSVFYGIISFAFGYYGEMITYLGMTTPISIMSVISWLRHPYKDTSEVKVHRLTRRQAVLMVILTVVITGIFYIVLKKLNTTNLIFSTISIATSFLASYLMLFRSSSYALAYSSNDIVIIILWILATKANKAYIPMVICFVMFLINDLYGFFNWQRIKKKQSNQQ